MEKTIIPGAVEGEVDPPSSKSYAQRAIAAAYLADLSSGGSALNNKIADGVPTDTASDDTISALRVVEALSSGANVLNIGESGLSARLFTPIAALSDRPITITGHGTILERPMTMMIEPLRALGVEVTDSEGYLPITVHGPMRGGVVEIDGSVSSQFLTGLLMALPLAQADTTIRVAGLKSIPYINMTLDVMDAFGIDIDHRDYEEFYVPGSQKYIPCDYTIEGDWSAASCLLVAGAIAGSIVVKNLRATSLQADVAVIEALSRAGARIEQSPDSVRVSRPSGGLHSFEFNATDCPDLFPALAALAANCEGVSTIIGTNRLTHKECNRAEAIYEEFSKLGIDVDISEPDIMRITGSNTRGESAKEFSYRQPVKVWSHGDHRMAMSLAVTALNAVTPVVITGAECVSKSYASFWEDFEKLIV